MIYLVTGNDKKVEVARAALGKYGISVEKVFIDTPEIQAETAEEVVKYSVKYAAEKTGKAVIKGDVALHIDDLNGFPGPFVKFINKWLSAKQMISLIDKESPAKFVDALGYCEPGSDPVSFVTDTHGKIIRTPSGNNGNMVDSLFIPNGFDKTIASLSEEEYIKLWDNDRYIQLYNYLKQKV